MTSAWSESDSGLVLPTWMRQRSRKRTNEDMVQAREHIWNLAQSNRPATGRNIYYTGIGKFWEKDEYTKAEYHVAALGPDELRCFYGNYDDVIDQLGVMREWFVDRRIDQPDETHLVRLGDGTDESRDGPGLSVCRAKLLVPFDWIVDATRGVDEIRAYDSVEGALDRLAQYYRQRMWTKQPRRFECWVESDSAGGIFRPVTHQWGVPLYSARGQSGKQLVFDAAMRCVEIGKPIDARYFGDWDSTGVVIPDSIEKRRNRYSGGRLDIDFKRLGVTSDDVHGGSYQSHHANRKDPNFKTFKRYCGQEGLDEDEAVEFEAIGPGVSRQRLERAIKDSIDWDAWREAEEEEERNHGVLNHLAEIAQDPERLERLIRWSKLGPPRRIRRSPRSR